MDQKRITFTHNKLKSKRILYTDTRFINLHKLKTKGIFYTDTRFISCTQVKN